MNAGASVPPTQAHPFRQLADNYGLNTAGWVPSRTPVVGDSYGVRISGIVRNGATELPVVYRVDIVDCGVVFM